MKRDSRVGPDERDPTFRLRSLQDDSDGESRCDVPSFQVRVLQRGVDRLGKGEEGGLGVVRGKLWGRERES